MQYVRVTELIRNFVSWAIPAKLKVLQAVLNASFLYGCKSWIGASCNGVCRLYMTGIKTTLGVRTSTTNDICLLELGLPTLEAFVKQKQHFFSQASFILAVI